MFTVIANPDDIEYVQAELLDMTSTVEESSDTVRNTVSKVFYTQDRFQSVAGKIQQDPAKTHKHCAISVVNIIKRQISKNRDFLQIMLCNGNSKQLQATILTLGSASATSA